MLQLPQVERLLDTVEKVSDQGIEIHNTEIIIIVSCISVVFYLFYSLFTILEKKRERERESIYNFKRIENHFL